jgi:phosphosulfolactate phosphohydrolase-like enzyme
VARLYPEPLAALRASQNGRALAKAGRSSDVDWCAQLSLLDVVGEMKSAVIRPVAR